MEQHYFQLGGEKSLLLSLYQRYSYNCASLAQAIYQEKAERGTLEALYGTLRTGASYLLLPATRDARLGGTQLRGHAHPASTYESISPVVFRSVDAFKETLKSILKKQEKERQKKQKMGAGDAKDNSMSVSMGISRGMFEHCRVLYRILEGDLNTNQQRLLSLSSDLVSSLRTFRITTFAVTFWSIQETVLDVGYAECAVGRTEPQTTRHFNVQKNVTLNPAKRATFKFGDTELVLDETIIRQKVIDLMSARGNPLLLLVWDEARTRRFLQNCGVVMGHWKFGLKDLFQYTHRLNHHAHPGDVFVVDVKSLCTTLFSSSQLVEELSTAASKLGIAMPPIGPLLPHQCAGNDARVLLDMWCILAEGGTIDEQHKYWKERQSAAPSAGPAPQLAPATGGDDDEDDDEERDPLWPPIGSKVAVVPPSEAQKDGLSDYESDFGDSDDEF